MLNGRGIHKQIMDRNKLGIDEFSDSFSREDVIFEYRSLLDKFKQLKSVHDEDQQKIYELKRSWETATAAESYLSQELEILTASQSTEIEKVELKFQYEIDVLKKKHSEVVSENNCLEQKVEEFRDRNDELERKIEELQNAPQKEVLSMSNGSMERELQLAKENLELLAKVDDCRDKMTSSMMTIAEKERQIDILKEQVECLQENLHAKREEVDEKTQLLESAQERIMELSTELAMLKSEPDNTNRKGNSLFAEVDDQRQQMKKMLTAQKKHYLHMKKCYNESEQEIRRLKRENAAMAKEMQVCATIFLSADKRYKEKLNERIQQLLKQNELMEKKLMWTQEKLVALSLDKGINWLDSMLAFCRNETEGLKEQLRSSFIKKGILEDQLVKSQQDLAKWRFEALKSRRIIIDRETLLEENKIEFKPIFFNPCESDVISAEPEIFTRKNTNANQSLQMIQPIQITESPPNRPAKEIIDTLNGTSGRNQSPLIKEEREISTVNASELHTTPTSSRKSSFDSIYKENLLYSKVNNTFIENKNSDEFTQNRERDLAVKFSEQSKTFPKTTLRAKTPFKKRPEIDDEEVDNSEENRSFEIYEDTICRSMSLKCKDITHLLNNSVNKTVNLIQDQLTNLTVYENSLADCKKVTQHDAITDTVNESNLQDFQIYEDTICRLPTVKVNDIDISKENIPVQSNEFSMDNATKSLQINSNILSDHNSPVLIEHNPKQPSPSSILVKSRNILDDSNEKTVTFSPELTTEIKDERDLKMDDKPIRHKSLVSVKRIVVKSNFNSK